MVDSDGRQDGGSTRSLRVANETLRNEVSQLQTRNRDLALRVQQATARLDALLARIPTE